MENRLLKNNEKRDWLEIEWVNEFYEFLKGELPEWVNTSPKLNHRKAFSVIYYLQEKFPIINEYIEKCDVCNELYNSYEEGLYIEKPYKGNYHFCNSCMEDVPYKKRI